MPRLQSDDIPDISSQLIARDEEWSVETSRSLRRIGIIAF
jgi:hypothetical protein